MHTVFDFHKGTQFLQLSNRCLTSFKAVHACKFTSQLVHSTVVVHDIDLWQIVALSNEEVIWIVRRSDFHNPCTKFRIRVLIRNDWDWLVHNWKDNIFTNQVLVTWIFWVNCNRNVTEHGFRTSCGNLKGTRTIFQHIIHVVESTLYVLVDNFNIRKGCASRWVPVDDKFTTVDPAFFVEFYKDLANGF